MGKYTDRNEKYRLVVHQRNQANTTLNTVNKVNGPFQIQLIGVIARFRISEILLHQTIEVGVNLICGLQNKDLILPVIREDKLFHGRAWDRDNMLAEGRNCTFELRFVCSGIVHKGYFRILTPVFFQRVRDRCERGHTLIMALR